VEVRSAPPARVGSKCALARRFVYLGLDIDSSVQLKPQTSHPRYRFAGVEVDPANFVVRVDGQPRECSRKAFELLVVLVRNARRPPALSSGLI
jgi:DNA-binding response OmpR family regulator